MRAGYGERLRQYFAKFNPLILIDLGPGVFKSATVDTNILVIQKSENRNKLKAVTITKEDKDIPDIPDFLSNNGVQLGEVSTDPWFIGNRAELRLKEKIERIGKPLKDWDVDIYYGIKTGLNEAFIIDTPTKERLCEEDPKSEEILKPILRGRDIKRYSYNWAGLWVIGAFPALHLNIDDYPALKKFFLDLGRKKDAIAQLETHSRMHGCSKMICKRLIGFYSNENNIEGLLSVYLRIYELEKRVKIILKKNYKFKDYFQFKIAEEFLPMEENSTIDYG